ncbi:AprI/Inh family metalloprotease inhibitor [Pseudaminobacter sp. 19-2017]|uniref:AprI/Inh family metalloprotease inhibitor n=1 Tax=Pseudaminobacter soli (ex Zhang et al. 2022) TaxID=2831468 RepID=A0A942IBD3_9HYPH|nr:AprI/Inh family metalloprotease inhibitor [Pseudaminobacter soli]MBS3651486.1 AprI/Inh family metalloprotease inhibitor [Pseudaminobacter soli]
MRLGLAAIGAATIMLCGGGSSAFAQTEADFVKAFAGPWHIVDSRYAAGSERCRVTLSNERSETRFGVTSSGCAAEAGLATSWSLADGQMSLHDSSGTAIARLGGNQRRMSGNTASGAPLILERDGVPGLAEVLEAARKQSGCFYAGFSNKCAPNSELQKPAEERPRISVLVNLNARGEARDDAPTIGVVPKDTCIQTDLCVNASDGAWCRADFDGKSGWLRKFALRQNRWPVVTFFNSCPSQ